MDVFGGGSSTEALGQAWDRARSSQECAKTVVIYRSHERASQVRIGRPGAR